VYYKDGDKTVNLNFAMISDELKHSTVAVYTFQDTLIDYLKKTISPISKVLYFTDGCKAQYKNRKNFANLVNHQMDFGIEAEWHFFATAHGKGKII
jgi:hypothetical protein